MASFSANVFMIGAQKSGTTYLASLLDQHPDVCVSNPKEPQFFTTQFDRGFEWYKACFSDPTAKIRLDASTTYSFLRPAHALEIDEAPGIPAPVPDRIQSACPDAKFIYVLRDPVKRMISAARHRARIKSIGDGQNLSLLDVAKNNPMLVLGGRYADQIDRYFDVFDKSRFLFIAFDDIKNKPTGVLEVLCDFLEITPVDFSLETATADKHTAFEYTGLGKRLRHMKGLKTLSKRLLPSAITSKLRAKVITAPSTLTFTHQDEAASLFSDDKARVRQMTGIEL